MRSLRRDDGNVAIIVALMMTTLFGVAALAIDAGMLFSRHSQVQAGADAAALAIAQECANLAVAALPDNCTGDLAEGVASRYLLANVLGAVGSPDIDLSSQHGGRAGRITVTGRSDEPSVFARFLGVERQRTSATATARWGPMTAVDDTFFLALCRSDLLQPGQPITLISASPDDRRPGAEPPTDECTGAPGAAPFGFIPPDDTQRCTAPVTLLPSTWLDVAPSAPGRGAQCHGALHELYDALRGTCGGRVPPWECGDWIEDRRNPVLAVYDASRGRNGEHPSYALVGFEITAMRLDHLEYDGPGRWACEPYDDPDGVAREDVQCIRGQVKPHVPPEDGPIVDLQDLNVGGIPDTTVLDVRLVD